MTTHKPEPFLNGAPLLATYGFHVFRLRYNSKRPIDRFVNGGPDEVATRDTNNLRQRAIAKPHSNIAIATGYKFQQGYLTVLDVDTYNGGVVPDWVIPTVEAASGNGGKHFYYVTERPVKSRPIAKGVDVKSNGGYVVAPPSVLPSGQYVWTTSPQRTYAAMMDVEHFEPARDLLRTDGVLPSIGEPVAVERRDPVAVDPKLVKPGQRHSAIVRNALRLVALDAHSDEAILEHLLRYNAEMPDPMPEDRARREIVAAIRSAHSVVARQEDDECPTI